MKTKKTLLLLLMLSISTLLTAQDVPGFLWAVQAGGSDSICWSYNMGVDPAGNPVITGHFRGTADFDPDPVDTYNLASNGLDDIFIMKLDATGDFLWAFSMGDVNDDRGKDIEIDASGNIYITGYFSGTMDVEPGAGQTLLSQTKNTAFVIKYNPSGNLVWAKQMGFPGDWGLAYGHNISIDNNQNVITVGQFVGRVDFDPGSGTFNLTSSSPAADGFIQKLTSNGDFVWAKQFSATVQIYISDMSVDPDGGIYTSGSFFGTVDFNPDKKLKYQLTSSGGSDVFFSKLDANGNFAWAKKVGGTGSDWGYVCHVDPAGFVYGTGTFYGTGDYDPGTGVFNMTPAGPSDLYLEKLDLNGNFIWAKQVGGPAWDSGFDIETDANSNIYLTGFFYSTTDFDMNPNSTYFLTVNGADDSFLAKYDAAGNLLWASQSGGTDHDWGIDISLDATGNIYVTGDFRETADFDPDGNALFNMTNTGGEDLFLQKFAPTGGNDCVVPAGLQVSNITATYADLSWDGVSNVAGYNVRYREPNGTWTESALLTGTVFTIDGLAAATVYEFQVRTTCLSNYSYSKEFITVGGCQDNYEPNEIMATAAAIPVNTDINALISANVDYDWYSFSTTSTAKNVRVTLTNLPANYDVVLYKSTGTQVGISQNTGEADETIIYNSNKAGSYYILVYGAGGVYDPINCYTLHLATSSTSFKSAVAEIYTVEENSLTLYPNPARNMLNIDYNSIAAGKVSVTMISISGQVILEQEYSAAEGQNHTSLNLEGIPNGLYMIKLTQEGESTMSKFMINR